MLEEPDTGCSGGGGSVDAEETACMKPSCEMSPACRIEACIAAGLESRREDTGGYKAGVRTWGCKIGTFFSNFPSRTACNQVLMETETTLKGREAMMISNQTHGIVYEQR